MAFTDKIIEALLENKEIIRQKTLALVKEQVEDTVPLVKELSKGERTTPLSQTAILELQQKLEPQLPTLCPTSRQLQSLLTLRRNIQEKVIGLAKLNEPVNSTANVLDTTANSIIITINILKALPIPNQFTTAGLLLTLGDLLDNIKQTVKDTRSQIQGLKYTTDSVNQTILGVSQQIFLIDNILRICAQDKLENSQKYSTEDQEQFNKLLEELNKSAYQQPLSQLYKGYRIDIENDPESPPIAPRRFATVYGTRGGIVYRGERSFSSSTQVLIDEAKFYIDQLVR